MINYEKKEAKSLNHILAVVNELDETLEHIDPTEVASVEHPIREWFIENRALHEIKQIINETNKFKAYEMRRRENNLADHAYQAPDYQYGSYVASYLNANTL